VEELEGAEIEDERSLFFFRGLDDIGVDLTTSEMSCSIRREEKEG